MHLDEATRIFKRLKVAFPMMELDEDETELIIKQLALLHDPSVLNAAVSQIIQRDERFPTIARIRANYRTINEVNASAKAALEAGSPAQGDTRIPEWVQIWAWWRQKTEHDRQEANTATLERIAAKRPPVRMKQFPQEDNDPKVESYSMAEYEEIRQEWVKDGSPSVGSAVEVLAGAGILR